MVANITPSPDVLSKGKMCSNQHQRRRAQIPHTRTAPATARGRVQEQRNIPPTISSRCSRQYAQEKRGRCGYLFCPRGAFARRRLAWQAQNAGGRRHVPTPMASRFGQTPCGSGVARQRAERSAGAQAGQCRTAVWQSAVPPTTIYTAGRALR